MCSPFSCIVTKNQTVFTHPNLLIHSHTEIMKHFNLKESSTDPRFNHFVKIEICPLDDNSYFKTPINEWDIKVDEKHIPSWYEDDKDSYETIIRKEAQSWLNRLKEIDWSVKTPGECCEYALYILKGRFSLGEKAIATNAGFSYEYALNVLKGPFPLGEKAIATDGAYSYSYAFNVLKGPFTLGEEVIAKDPWYSYYYARHIKRPFFIR